MTPEKLKAMLAETIAPIAQRLAKIEGGALHANTSTVEMVEPHATTLEDIASAMEADGVGGGNSKFGHVTALRCMAASMRREAAAGKIPHIWRDHDYPTYASATDKLGIKAQVAIAVQAATTPLQDELKATNDKITAAQTKIKDLTEKGLITAPAPDRKTLPPALISLLEGGAIAIGDDKTLQLKN